MDGNDRDRIVVRAIVDLARALGLLVVAEGIEHATQLARLKDLGVATWPGFLKSGPAPGNELDRQSVVKGTSRSVRVVLGGRRYITKQKQQIVEHITQQAPQK